MNRIKQLRKSKHITMEQLALSIGVGKPTVSRWESEKILPTLENWQALADYFNVSVPYLQGKIFKEDLSPELQDMFDDIQDLVTLVVPDYAVERVLTALINSFKYNYESDGWD